MTQTWRIGGATVTRIEEQLDPMTSSLKYPADGKLEAGVGIEPAYTALQAAITPHSFIRLRYLPPKFVTF